jgi:hypothetical protein
MPAPSGWLYYQISNVIQYRHPMLLDAEAVYVVLGNALVLGVSLHHYYKMWVQFISPCSLDQGIHEFTAASLILIHYNQWIHSKFCEITWHTRVPFVVVHKKHCQMSF